MPDDVYRHGRANHLPSSERPRSSSPRGLHGYVESFYGKFRDECLNGELFYTLGEAKILIERWRREFHEIRPHSSLGYKPPASETIQPPLLASGQASQGF